MAAPRDTACATAMQWSGDGTVEWRAVTEQGTAKKPDTGKQDAKPERPRFVDEEVAPGVRLISYLSSSGFTLTVVPLRPQVG